MARLFLSRYLQKVLSSYLCCSYFVLKIIPFYVSYHLITENFPNETTFKGVLHHTPGSDSFALFDTEKNEVPIVLSLFSFSYLVHLSLSLSVTVVDS